MAVPEFETIDPSKYVWYRGGRKGHEKVIKVFKVEGDRVHYRAKHMGGWKKFSMSRGALELFHEISEADVSAEER